MFVRIVDDHRSDLRIPQKVGGPAVMLCRLDCSSERDGLLKLSFAHDFPPRVAHSPCDLLLRDATDPLVFERVELTRPRHRHGKWPKRMEHLH